LQSSGKPWGLGALRGLLPAACVWKPMPVPLHRLLALAVWRAQQPTALSQAAARLAFQMKKRGRSRTLSNNENSSTDHCPPKRESEKGDPRKTTRSTHSKVSRKSTSKLFLLVGFPPFSTRRAGQRRGPEHLRLLLPRLAGPPPLHNRRHERLPGPGPVAAGARGSSPRAEDRRL